MTLSAVDDCICFMVGMGLSVSMLSAVRRALVICAASILAESSMRFGTDMIADA